MVVYFIPEILLEMRNKYVQEPPTFPFHLARPPKYGKKEKFSRVKVFCKSLLSEENILAHVDFRQDC